MLLTNRVVLLLQGHMSNPPPTPEDPVIAAFFIQNELTLIHRWRDLTLTFRNALQELDV